MTLILQSVTTQSTGFTSTSVSNEPGKRMVAKVTYSLAVNDSGKNDVTFYTEHSSGDGKWFLHTSGADQSIALDAKEPKLGYVILPVVSPYEHVRLVMVMQGGGASPQITYSATLSPD